MRTPKWRLVAVAAALAMSLRASAQGAVEEAPAGVPEPVAVAMMRLAAAGPADRLAFLGPGDGRTVLAAASRSGVKTAMASTDPFSADLSVATVVALDISEQAAARLRPLLLILRPGTRVVSPDAHFGDWKPDRTVAVGQANAHLWTVPANLTGNWCGQGTASGAVLRLDQRFQVVDGEFSKATKSTSLRRPHRRNAHCGCRRPARAGAVRRRPARHHRPGQLRRLPLRLLRPHLLRHLPLSGECSYHFDRVS